MSTFHSTAESTNIRSLSIQSGSGSSISSPASLGEETFESQSKKYENCTNEQQKYLVQLWAEKQDMLNSKNARNAWPAIAEAINNKFTTNKMVDKCIRKIKYLVDAYKEKNEWNRNQTGGNLRKSKTKYSVISWHTFSGSGKVSFCWHIDACVTAMQIACDPKT